MRFLVLISNTHYVGLSTPSSRQSSNLRNSVDEATILDAQTRSSIEPSAATPAVPPSHETNASHDMDISDDISSILSDGFSPLSLDLSLDMSLLSSPNATPQEPNTEPAPEFNAGLKALFQQPVRLRPHSASYPIVRPDDSVLTSPSVQASLTTTPSVKSDRSRVSESSTSGQSSGFQSQTSPSSVESANQPDSKFSRSVYKAESLKKRVALSQLFIYTHDPRTSRKPADAGTGEKKTRSASTPSATTMTGLSPPYESATAPQSPDSGLIVLEPDCRRGMVDSQQWQRKTRLLQLNPLSDDT